MSRPALAISRIWPAKTLPLARVASTIMVCLDKLFLFTAVLPVQRLALDSEISLQLITYGVTPRGRELCCLTGGVMLPNLGTPHVVSLLCPCIPDGVCELM